MSIWMVINKVINIMQREIDQNDKMKTIVLQLNKMGLSYLTQADFHQAIAYFKKAEKIVEQQLIVSPQSLPINQIAAVTFNNIACYYKKTKKPKVALAYLKKGLEIQIHKLNDWISIASTHLNICAIYSYLNKHEEGLNHVQLALAVLEKHAYEKEDKSEAAKCFWNIKMLCLYNKAIEQQHLKQFSLSLQSYKQAKELAKLEPRKNISIIMSCDDATGRMDDNFAMKKKMMMNLLLKKKEDEEKGHYDFMRRNVSRVRKEQDLDMGQYGTAQLIKRGDKIRLKRINTNANNSKQSLHELKHQSTKVSNHRSQTEQTSINHYY